MPEGKHKTRRTALRHATGNSSIDLLLSDQSSQPYILLTAICIKQFQFHITFQFIESMSRTFPLGFADFSPSSVDLLLLRDS